VNTIYVFGGSVRLASDDDTKMALKGRLAVFVMALLVGGAATGTALAAFGRWLSPPLWLSVPVLLGVGLAVLVRETKRQRWWLPELPWQVPRHWLAHRWLGAAAFGSIMGAGVFTRQVSGLFHIYVLGCVAWADPLAGAITGLVFASAYALGFADVMVRSREGSPVMINDIAVRLGMTASTYVALAAPLVALLPIAAGG
jgi:hypothetical protein